MRCNLENFSQWSHLCLLRVHQIKSDLRRIFHTHTSDTFCVESVQDGHADHTSRTSKTSNDKDIVTSIILFLDICEFHTIGKGAINFMTAKVVVMAAMIT